MGIVHGVRRQHMRLDTHMDCMERCLKRALLSFGNPRPFVRFTSVFGKRKLGGDSVVCKCVC